MTATRADVERAVSGRPGEAGDQIMTEVGTRETKPRGAAAPGNGRVKATA